MKKTISSILAILVLGVVIFIACSKENNETVETVNSLKSEDIKSTINALLVIRDRIGKIAFEKKIPVSEIKSAYENNDTLKIQQLLGLTDSDIKDLNFRLAVLRERLLLLNPEIKKL